MSRTQLPHSPLLIPSHRPNVHGHPHYHPDPHPNPLFHHSRPSSPNPTQRPLSAHSEFAPPRPPAPPNPRPSPAPTPLIRPIARGRPPAGSGSGTRRAVAPVPRRRGGQHPQSAVDAFWAGFSSRVPGKAFTVLPDNLHARRVAASFGVGASGQSVTAGYEAAREACVEKVRKIAAEGRRLNVKYRDAHFDIESDFRRWVSGERVVADTLMGLNEIRADLKPASVKRVEDIFEQPRFFIEGATASDVRQGKEGDCWFMSALCVLSNKEGLIQRVCVAKDEKVGVYGFVFHRDGEWISEVIDDKLYLIKEDFNDATLERNRWLELQNRTSPEEEWRKVMQTGSRALYFAQCSDPNETWLPLLEKAYAKAHGDYSALESGFVGEGIEDLTGGVTTELFSTDILDKDKFWRDELMNVNKEFLFGCGQMNGRSESASRNGIIGKHAYSVMEAREVNGQRLLKLRNPWGNTEWRGAWSDGSAEWTPEWMQLLNHKFGDDGVFWISFEDVLKSFQHLDRTRLFGPEWTVTQQWTSVNVPWSVEYLDTKFKVTLEKSGPTVIVLSQLDDRYFRGLEGQYEFHLQFRLHKDDEEDYIVRSNAAYYMKRSVSTELDLEAGTYFVLLKITAKRYRDDPTVEEVIAATCQFRREKLLSIGLSYDLAHAKGQFRELQEEKAKKERAQRRQRRKELARKMFDARVREYKKKKLRDLKRKLKDAERSNRRAVLSGLGGLGIHDDMHHSDITVNEHGMDSRPATPPTASTSSTATTSSTNASFSRQTSSPQVSRQSTLSNVPLQHQTSFPARNPMHRPSLSENFNRSSSSSLQNIHTNPQPQPIRVMTPPMSSRTLSGPDIHVQPPGMHGHATQHGMGYPPPTRRTSTFHERKLTLDDISSDDLSWDSELDAPTDSDSDSQTTWGPRDREPRQDRACVPPPWQHHGPSSSRMRPALDALDEPGPPLPPPRRPGPPQRRNSSRRRRRGAPPRPGDDSDFSDLEGPPLARDRGGLGDDPWNAVCVLGLRVYSLSKNGDVKISVTDENPSVWCSPVEGDVDDEYGAAKARGDVIDLVDVQRRLDVDDACKDAVREPVSPVSPR